MCIYLVQTSRPSVGKSLSRIVLSSQHLTQSISRSLFTYTHLEPWTLKPPMLRSNMIAVSWVKPRNNGNKLLDFTSFTLLIAILLCKKDRTKLWFARPKPVNCRQNLDYSSRYIDSSLPSFSHKCRDANVLPGLTTGRYLTFEPTYTHTHTHEDMTSIKGEWWVTYLSSYLCRVEHLYNGDHLIAVLSPRNIKRAGIEQHQHHWTRRKEKSSLHNWRKFDWFSITYYMCWIHLAYNFRTLCQPQNFWQ